MAFGGWYLLAGAVTVAGFLSVPLVLVAFGAFFAFLHATIGSRDRSMLDRIADLSAEHVSSATDGDGGASSADRSGTERDDTGGEPVRGGQDGPTVRTGDRR